MMSYFVKRYFGNERINLCIDLYGRLNCHYRFLVILVVN